MSDQHAPTHDPFESTPLGYEGHEARQFGCGSLALTVIGALGFIAGFLA